MKTHKNILIAFLLNLAFSVFEFFGGIFTGSVAILSDAVHDMGDAASIGISYFLEKKSKHKADAAHTYGYARYSVLGSVFTTLILLLGSAAVIYNAVNRIIAPQSVNYDGMILFAVIGVVVNGGAAFITRDGHSLNQKAVNLHMLEDVLGWIAVLVGAIVMRFTNLAIIDPILSLGIALFIAVNAIKTMKEALELFLEKAPKDVDTEELKKSLLAVEGVLDVHHIHLWSLDGENNFATMHIVTNGDGHEIKDAVREILRDRGIGHATLELEAEHEHCHHRKCTMEAAVHSGHHHHHHHH